MLDLIRHSNLIEGIDDPHEDELSFYAWIWLSKKSNITPTRLLELHRLITCNQLGGEAGQYRSAMVSVGGYIPPAPLIARHQADEWCIELLEHWQDLDPKEMHIRFERIHPFIDGNGRTGRMLMWWHELRLGKEPTLIRSNEADRHYYYQWFKEAVT